MPEIASFVKELLEEDVFGTEYYNKIDDRVQELNVSQLKAMHKYLKETADNAKFHVWRDANADIENHYGDYMEEKVRAIEEKERVKRALEVKIERKKVLKEDLKGEAARVKKFIEDHAMERARAEVTEAEKQRIATERADILRKAFGLEQMRFRLFSLAAGILVVGVTIPAVLLKGNILLMAIIIAAVLTIAVLIVLRAFNITKVVPTTVSQSSMEEKIKLRNLDLRFQAENEMLRKEQEFKLQLIVDKEERRKRRKEEKEKRAIERELAEIERLEKIAAHESQLDARFSLFSAMSAANIRATASQLEEGSEYTDCTESVYSPRNIRTYGSTNTWGSAFATVGGGNMGSEDSGVMEGEGMEDGSVYTYTANTLMPHESSTWGSIAANQSTDRVRGERRGGDSDSESDEESARGSRDHFRGHSEDHSRGHSGGHSQDPYEDPSRDQSRERNRWSIQSSPPRSRVGSGKG